ncbi:MAG: hypothetical protein JO319_13720 [Acidobacteriaceae bacterium]|nr:hypothetical protein [Acidobacteriaceae bacterium]
MSINDPKIEALRVKFNAAQLRREREYVKRNGSYNGSTCVRGSGRFLKFMNNIEKFERARLRFASHVARER